MNEMMPVYYLNMDARADRRAFMEEQFQRLGLQATRISSFTPADMTDNERLRYCDGRRAYSVSEPQYCCARTHFQAWRRFLETGHEYAAIFEDDVVLSSRIKSFLSGLSGMQHDILRLESAQKPQLNSNYLNQVSEGIRFREFRAFTWGSGGYVITRECAEKILSDPQLYDRPVDWTMFCTFEGPARRLRLLQAEPALCIHSKHHEPESDNSVHTSDIVDRIAPSSLGALFVRRLRKPWWRTLRRLQRLRRPDLKWRVIEFAAD